LPHGTSGIGSDSIAPRSIAKSFMPGLAGRSLLAPFLGGGERPGGDELPNSRSRRRRSPRVTNPPRPRPEVRR
jgi:hypothetical protein